MSATNERAFAANHYTTLLAEVTTTEAALRESIEKALRDGGCVSAEWPHGWIDCDLRIASRVLARWAFANGAEVTP